MPYLRLIHWNASEAKERARRLRAVGYRVDCAPLDAPALKKLRVHPPAAVVIDLSRLPSHGRDVGVVIRGYKATRRVPIVFVGGEDEKVARVRALLPDAVYATWSVIRSALKGAIAHPPADPVVHRSNLDGYSGRPLPRKLGIKPGSRTILLDAPPGFEETLGELPEGAMVVHESTPEKHDVTLCFIRSRDELENRIGVMATLAESGKLWIAWPKQASGVKTDVTQPVVREAGLAAGMVDFKVCSLDTTWSALCFTRRKLLGTISRRGS